MSDIVVFSRRKSTELSVDGAGKRGCWGGVILFCKFLNVGWFLPLKSELIRF